MQIEETDWMIKSVIKRGKDAFKYYQKEYNALPSCKFVEENYDGCMVEKINFAYEQTIAKFPILKMRTLEQGGQNGYR